GDRNACRNAGLAGGALGPVDMAAAAAKAQLRQMAVKPAVHGLFRVHENRGRVFALQIAALVRMGGKEADGAEIGHGITRRRKLGHRKSIRWSRSAAQKPARFPTEYSPAASPETPPGSQQWHPSNSGARFPP